MLKNFAKVSVALMAAMLVFAALAAAKNKTITVYYDSVLPDGQNIKAGQYAVVVNTTTHKVQFLQKGKVILESSCNCTENGKKNDKSECIFIKGDKGKETLQQMKVGGDTKTIVLEGKGM